MTKILVFSPHPDDLDFGCAGTVAKKVKEGHEVVYCIISGGCRGAHKVQVSENELRKIREREQKKAAAVVGVKRVIFLREQDGEIENTKKLRKKIVKVIREIRPDIIITFDPANRDFSDFYRSHRDHRLGTEAVFDAAYPDATNAAFFPELSKKYPPHQIKEAWFFATNKPNLCVDISKTINKKLQALKQHKSQIENFKLVEKIIKDWAKRCSRGAKKKYTEEFRVMKF